MTSTQQAMSDDLYTAGDETSTQQAMTPGRRMDTWILLGYSTFQVYGYGILAFHKYPICEHCLRIPPPLKLMHAYVWRKGRPFEAGGAGDPNPGTPGAGVGA